MKLAYPMFLIKSFFITVLFSAFNINAQCQVNTDSLDIEDKEDSTTQIVALNTITPRKRGVYKTYEEYLSNSPSVNAEFKLTPLRISKNNPLIVEADVDYKGKRPKKIWGVSDGENVYIRVMQGRLFKNHYFKLQCDGPRPYIFLVENIVVVPLGAGLLAAATVAAGTAALPPFVSIAIVRDKTNYFKPILSATNARIKRYLEEYPDLLEAYKKEPNHQKATKTKYLTEYNKRKLMEAGSNNSPSSEKVD